MFNIYNSLTQKKAPFTPITPNQVGIYVCGMTVYDYCHIGHARVMVVFDMVVRQLRRHFDSVKYVRNITDIDDKIIKQAIQNQESIQDLSIRFIKAMHSDEKALLVIPPDIEPKATEHLEQMFVMVKMLIDNGLAYQADNGDVYYSVRKFQAYGQLSGKSLDDLQSGARVAVDKHKKDPLDFVLWKKTKSNEPNWASPWGIGRPGWHLECSAMSCHYLGKHFDIHGGGSDLVFPHHENEIAQSQGANNTAFVNIWMHIGFVNIDQEKMSKSLNNFTTIKDALKQYDGEVLRYFILSSHYRSPLNYSEDNLINAKNALTRLYLAMSHIDSNNKQVKLRTTSIDAEFGFSKRFFDALDDDFNTPTALSVLFDLVKKINTEKIQQPLIAQSLLVLLKALGSHLGLLQNTDFLIQNHSLNTDEIETKIQQRNQARANKDFALSDKIRDELSTLGIILEDNQHGTTWRKQ